MSNTTSRTDLKTLIDEFMKVVDAGDEAAAEDFLVKHIKEFPSEIQQKITYAFFSRAAQEKAGLIRDTATVQKEALDLYAEIEKAQKALGDQKKEAEVRSKLGV